ncbi:hypothetical protein F5Y16DRAFT_384124 [Xylariaceae sp. FL0255]|nr:hypothetical protein F5Y16DRAFT_384124 [Xylariaceae sp. FL0255]
MSGHNDNEKTVIACGTNAHTKGASATQSSVPFFASDDSDSPSPDQDPERQISPFAIIAGTLNADRAAANLQGLGLVPSQAQASQQEEQQSSEVAEQQPQPASDKELLSMSEVTEREEDICADFYSKYGAGFSANVDNDGLAGNTSFSQMMAEGEPASEPALEPREFSFHGYEVLLNNDPTFLGSITGELFDDAMWHLDDAGASLMPEPNTEAAEPVAQQLTNPEYGVLAEPQGPAPVPVPEPAAQEHQQGQKQESTKTPSPIEERLEHLEQQRERREKRQPKSSPDSLEPKKRGRPRKDQTKNPALERNRKLPQEEVEAKKKEAAENTARFKAQFRLPLSQDQQQQYQTIVPKPGFATHATRARQGEIAALNSMISDGAVPPPQLVPLQAAPITSGFVAATPGRSVHSIPQQQNLRPQRNARLYMPTQGPSAPIQNDTSNINGVHSTLAAAAPALQPSMEWAQSQPALLGFQPSPSPQFALPPYQHIQEQQQPLPLPQQQFNGQSQYQFQGQGPQGFLAQQPPMMSQQELIAQQQMQAHQQNIAAMSYPQPLLPAQAQAQMMPQMMPQIMPQFLPEQEEQPCYIPPPGGFKEGVRYKRVNMSNVQPGQQLLTGSQLPFPVAAQNLPFDYQQQQLQQQQQQQQQQW